MVLLRLLTTEWNHTVLSKQMYNGNVAYTAWVLRNVSVTVISEQSTEK